MSFAINLLKLRESIGKSRKQMADEIGVSLSAYTNYEAGNRVPKIDIIPKLATALHVSTDELLGFTPDNKVAYWIAYLRKRGFSVVDDGETITVSFGKKPGAGYSYSAFVTKLDNIEHKTDALVATIRDNLFVTEVKNDILNILGSNRT